MKKKLEYRVSASPRCRRASKTAIKMQSNLEKEDSIHRDEKTSLLSLDMASICKPLCIYMVSMLPLTERR